ncbi:MAG: SDR family oxidoreductase [Cyclobacteriaceae bacterium]
MFDLSGKKAVVTGGGSGIGEAISKKMAAQGCFVYLLDFDETKGSAVAQTIKDSGNLCEFVKCDVSKEESIIDAFAKVDGDLDILVNNAGIAHVGNLENTSYDDFQRVYDVNVKGVFGCLQTGIKLMKNKGGAIINMSSIASLVGISDRFAYSMSKGAVYTMTLSVAKDYLKDKIRCNCIAPARVHTPFVDGFIAKNYPGQEQEMFENLSKTQPIGRMAEPDEVASLVVYLASDEASFITGTCYPVDGGFITLNN